MKNSIVFILLFHLILSRQAVAQEKPYELSAGVRVGFTSGVTAKYFLTDAIALEGIAGLRYFSGTSFTGLVEYHIPDVLDTENLYLYIGGGFHSGYRFYKNGWGNYKNGTYAPVFFAGVDLIGGLEYKISDHPITISFDVKPHVDVLGFFPSFYGAGFSARYIFK